MMLEAVLVLAVEIYLVAVAVVDADLMVADGENFSGVLVSVYKHWLRLRRRVPLHFFFIVNRLFIF